MDTKKLIHKSFNILLITIIAASIIAVLGITLIFCNFIITSSGSGYGTVADWVIAAANVAMAIAALYAAIRANKWLADKVKLNNLDSSHKFALDFEKSLWELFAIMRTDTLLVTEVEAFIDNEMMIIESTLTKIVAERETDPHRALAFYSKIEMSQALLKRFNIKTSNELSSIVDEIKKLNIDYHRSLHDYLAAVVREHYLTKKGLQVYYDIEKIKIRHIEYLNKVTQIHHLFLHDILLTSLNSDYSFKTNEH